MTIESKELLQVLSRALQRHITSCEIERESAIETGYTMDEVDDFLQASKDIHFSEMILQDIKKELR